jgi:hypothetical protein
MIVEWTNSSKWNKTGQITTKNYTFKKVENFKYICITLNEDNNYKTVFDVHGSLHHGNVYVQLNVQLDVHVFICILYSSPFLALHVSGAIAPIQGGQTAALQP